jgi:hypothetical protein
MDLNALPELISNLGFPIAVVVGLGWYVVRLQDKHDAQVTAFVEALNKNTVAITSLTEKMNKD